MKIEGNLPGIDTSAADSAQRVATDHQQRVNRAAGRSNGAGDTVEVSADAKLLSEAAKAAQAAPDIRADVVERMKEKLAAGEVGNDAGRLADRMLDDILKP
jgi:flagellar biosynthesis anti-sigma factor FlgM